MAPSSSPTSFTESRSSTESNRTKSPPENFPSTTSCNISVDYLWGFFGEWEGNRTTLISLNNSGATYEGYTLDKSYYTTGQFSRFIEPGAERIDALSDTSSVLTTAFLTENELIIVAINTGHTSTAFSLDLASVPSVTEFAAVRTSPSENWATLQPVVVNGSSATTTLAGNSITTFITSLPFMPGDYTEDRVVDSADLAEWTVGFGVSVSATHGQGVATLTAMWMAPTSSYGSASWA